MADRPYLAPQVVIPSPQGSPTNGASMAASITSAPTILQQKSMCNYSASWSGTSPVGTLSVQASNDYSQDVTGKVSNAGTWNTLTLELNGQPVQSIPVTGNTGSAMIDLDSIAAYAVRLIYTSTSGTGTMQALIVCKVQ